MELYHLDWDAERETSSERLLGLIAPTSDGTAFEAGIREALDRGAYRKVATITGHAVEDVFRLTQNIDENWTRLDRPGITPVADSPARSTSVGDVILDDEGACHAIAAVGLVRLSGAAPTGGG